MDNERDEWLLGVITMHRFMIETFIASGLFGKPDALRQFDATAVILRKAFAERMQALPESPDDSTDAIKREALGELDLILAPARRHVAAGKFLG